MKLGCCVNMFGDASDPVGKKYIHTLAENGYDYVELPLAQVMDYTDAEFEELLAILKEEGIPCETCNNFFPASVKLTGPNVDEELIRDYVTRAVGRAVRLGAKRIVLGSSGAKNVPEGFDFDVAFEQIVKACRIISEIVKDKEILIVLEPLNKKESNIILNLTDSKKLMQASERAEITQLIDYYHHVMEDESPEIVAECCKNIHHVHFADPEIRSIPVEEKPEYEAFLKVLKNGGYDERISVEAYSKDPEGELPKAKLLKEIWERI